MNEMPQQNFEDLEPFEVEILEKPKTKRRKTKINTNPHGKTKKINKNSVQLFINYNLFLFL